MSRSGCLKGLKSSWPEAVGMQGEAAEDFIKSELSGVSVRVNIVIVKPESFVTDDFRCDRVRIFVDDLGIVNSEPRVG